MKKISIIGAGNMGRAIINSIRGHCKITASDKDRNKLKGLKVKTTADNKKAVKDADIIILAVKPQDMEAVLDEIKYSVNPRQLIISITAGITTKGIEKVLGKIPVVRAMPNTPLLAGEGMSVICPGKNAKPSHVNTANRIFSRSGKVINIRDENLMDVVTAVSGSGPAYVYLFIESLVKSAVKSGIRKEIAQELVLQTIKGAVKLLEETGKSPEELRRQVTSPGGTTEAALKILEEKVFEEIIHLAVKKAVERSKELSK